MAHWIFEKQHCVYATEEGTGLIEWQNKTLIIIKNCQLSNITEFSEKEYARKKTMWTSTM